MRKIPSNISKLVKDIESIKIQGATNVALATISGMKMYADSFKGTKDSLLKGLLYVGELLSDARENEPLARNALRYVKKEIENNNPKDVEEVKDQVIDACDGYEGLINSAKISMIEVGTEALKKENVVLTHCHSSSAINILKNVAKYKEIEGKKFQIVSTETRPLYQGRKTAKELFEAGIDVTLIADSAASAFIIDDKYLPVGAVIVGCDELLSDSSFINKVGTYAMAIAAEKGADEFYVATTLLKLDPKKSLNKVEIERRRASEVWKDAPKDLKIINPSFDRVKSNFVTGYITEAGVIKAGDIEKSAKRIYPWIFS